MLIKLLLSIVLINAIKFILNEEYGFVCYFTVGFFLFLLYGLWNWV